MRETYWFYIMACGLWFPIVLNNWLGTITNPIALFILGATWTTLYCNWWEKETEKTEFNKK